MEPFYSRRQFDTVEQNNIAVALHILLTVLKKPSMNATSFKINLDGIRALMTRFDFVPIAYHMMLL